MTISEMSDIELVRAVAEEVMGFSRNTEWWGSSYKRHDRWFYYDPLTNYNHTFQVVERMRELGWFWELIDFNHPLGVLAKFEWSQGQHVFRSFNADLKRAILEAALWAVRERNKNEIRRNLLG